jgi:hypothetical protein
MQPYRMPYEPSNLTPCFALRSRREVNTVDAANSRLVNHWQTDAPQIQVARRDLSGAIFYMDMNPTSSRLYREDLRQSQPYVIPGSASASAAASTQVNINDKITQSLSTIQGIDTQYQTSIKGLGYDAVRNGLVSDASKALLASKVKEENNYKFLLAQQKLTQIDTLSDNPYFDKYDVASDSRNIIRELRGAVSEDIYDRGIRESQQLLRREMDSRWTPQGYAEDKGIDSLSAYELMRPKFTNMTKTYKK